MGQNQEANKAKLDNAPDLDTLVDKCWNPVADALEGVGLYLLANGASSLKHMGRLGEAREIIADALQAAIDIHNRDVMAENDAKNETEAKLRAELKRRQEEKGKGEVLKAVKTKVEKPGEGETEPEPDKEDKED